MIDFIERETFIAAPIERVWDIITLPEHIGRWFGDAGAERDGDVIRMRWEEHGEAELRIQHWSVCIAICTSDRFALW